MLGSPPDENGREVVETIRGIEGVSEVHHVHLWQMQEHETALACHVVLSLEAWLRFEAIKREIKDRLRDRFDITHSSLEFEHEDRAHENAKLYGHG
jgi:cobalt-zinc-cadmium efflux system protein